MTPSPLPVPVPVPVLVLVRVRVLVLHPLLLLLLLLLPSACSGRIDGAPDSSPGPTADSSPADTCAVPCAPPEVCRFGLCLPPPSPCTDDADCLGDRYCDESTRECLPFGVGPGGNHDDECVRRTTPGVFLPEVQCEWLGPPPGDPWPEHRNVLSTPMVIDFAGGSDPELSRPSIVFISYNFNDGGALSCVGTNSAYYGVIRVIDGRTCAQTASIAEPTALASTSLALGDLDGDGLAEIVGAVIGGGLAAWTGDGAGGFRLHWRTASTFAAGLCDWAGPSLHDLDDDGFPEVLFYGAVFDALGNSITEVLGPLSSGGSTGYIPIVADVDTDGAPELVHGSAIWGWNAGARTWVQESTLGAPAQTAVADLGTFGFDPAADTRGVLDGIAEVVAVGQGRLRVHTLAGRVIYEAALPGGGQGGPPTIADFDGDGRAEMATAGAAAYTVFDLDCRPGVGDVDAMLCSSLTTDGILWSRPSQDASSNVTGSSVFDFEGDGRAEAVYADECFTRVYDGVNGQVVYSRYRTSCTWYENPVVADVDGDYNAEIVVPSNSNCSVSCPGVDPIFDGVACFDPSDCPGLTLCGRDDPADALGRCRCVADADCGGDGFACLDPIAGVAPAGRVCRASHPGPGTATGVRVLSDGLDRWVNTRKVWNQHAYAVTNVDERGRIPRTSEWLRNWELPGLNNFRQNAPGDGVGAAVSPDLTVRDASVSCLGPGGAEVTATVCNRGTEPVADGLAVAVYAGQPPGAPVACVAVTTRDLLPGQCTEVACLWDPMPATPTDATVVADDDGAGDGAVSGENGECREENNSFLLAGVSCL